MHKWPSKPKPKHLTWTSNENQYFEYQALDLETKISLNALQSLNGGVGTFCSFTWEWLKFTHVSLNWFYCCCASIPLSDELFTPSVSQA